jgi:hypothetical protein
MTLAWGNPCSSNVIAAKSSERALVTAGDDIDLFVKICVDRLEPLVEQNREGIMTQEKKTGERPPRGTPFVKGHKKMGGQKRRAEPVDDGCNP